MVKDGVIIIDVGINHDANGFLTGDADITDLAAKAGFITPVPNGVGPLTVISLFENFYKTLK